MLKQDKHNYNLEGQPIPIHLKGKGKTEIESNTDRRFWPDEETYDK